MEKLEYAINSNYNISHNEISPQFEEEKIELLNQLPDDVGDILEENKSSLEEIRQVKKLLDKIPNSLQERYIKRIVDQDNITTQKIISNLKQFISIREKEGYKKIEGYHVSNIDLPIGSYIIPGRDGAIHYSEDITNLYGRYGGGWLYIVEGCSTDKITDKKLGWRIARKKMKIIGKIPLNEETQQKIGWQFAKCEYH